MQSSDFKSEDCRSIVRVFVFLLLWNSLSFKVMIQLKSLVYQWVLFCFFSLFHNQALVRGRVHSLDHSKRGHSARMWSEWSQWSHCSRSCGGGVRQKTRACVRRTHGLRLSNDECLGQDINYELCSTNVCQDQKGFLDVQCSQKNGQTILGKRIDDWIPYRHRKNPCELQCWPRDRSLVHSFGKVVDGTECAASHITDSAVCINGRCTQVDCAGRLGSRSHRDRCGVCQGDNSTCVRYHNTLYGRPRYKTRGGSARDPNELDYISIFSIPAGAMHISVSENSKTNFLVLVDHMGNYLINGNRKVQSPGRILVHGSEFKYNRTANGRETLSCEGPTKFIVKVMVTGSGDIPTVHYEYWISTIRPIDQSRSQPLIQTNNHSLLHNLVETSSPDTKISPKLSSHGYKSFYHRNEILESVPSWSIKRHKILKPSLVKQFTNADSSAGKWRNGTNDDRLRHLETFNRNSFGTSVPTTTKSDYGTERYSDFERPNGTSSFTRQSRLVTNYEDRIRTFKVAETTPGVRRADSGRQIVPPKIKPKVESRVKRKRKSHRSGHCPPCIRNKQQTKSFCISDFVIRTTLLASETHHGSTRFEFDVIQSFKNSIPMLSREYVWTPDIHCPCPKLRVGKEYIVMGRLGVLGGRRESQLIVDRDSFVRKYTQKRAGAIQRLVRDRHSVCSKY
ncbi:hypothetical protein JTE90_001592 [Oedothorax gibbosus]|uniref:NTR domain-containing protein n=1 Tax=Oedothorax gibbosus TaxID=931172 RepID=A0AAV6VNP9_9ARAC|nr:hypothetical protein JTE90_001592 [Oedothorax gibbosus]